MNHRRVDFLCIGTQKGGSTTLRAYLRGHHQILVPDRELHFFDNENAGWPSPSINQYHQTFNSSNISASFDTNASRCQDRHRLMGEVTPIYMYWKPSAYRIYHYNPAIKLIILLRNPMARAYSHWAMELARGNEVLSFSDSIRQEQQRCNDALPLQHRVYSYLDRGFYSVQLQRLLNFFPFNQLLVIRSENLFLKPQRVLNQVSEFLEIDPFSFFIPQHKRTGIYTEALCSEDWRYMYSRVRDDIDNLEGLLGWDLDLWRNS